MCNPFMKWTDWLPNKSFMDSNIHMEWISFQINYEFIWFSWLIDLKIENWWQESNDIKNAVLTTSAVIANEEGAQVLHVSPSYLVLSTVLQWTSFFWSMLKRCIQTNVRTKLEHWRQTVHRFKRMFEKETCN